MLRAVIDKILSAGLIFALFSAVSFTASAREDWELIEGDVGCVLRHIEGERSLMVAMLSIPDHVDAGILLWQFHDKSFDISPSTASDVTLNFDSGVVDGYRVKPLDAGGYEVKMMTYDLGTILDPAKLATTLLIVSGNDKAIFDMHGFGDLLPALRKCANGREE